MKSREKLLEELKSYRETLSSKGNTVSKGKQKVKVMEPKNKGYMDALILALLTGLASGIIIGVTLVITNVIS